MIDPNRNERSRKNRISYSAQIGLLSKTIVPIADYIASIPYSWYFFRVILSYIFAERDRKIS